MESWRRSVQILLSLATVVTIVTTSDAAPPTKVRMSYSSRSNSNTPFVIAPRKGFFPRWEVLTEKKKTADEVHDFTLPRDVPKELKLREHRRNGGTWG